MRISMLRIKKWNFLRCSQNIGAQGKFCLSFTFENNANKMNDRFYGQQLCQHQQHSPIAAMQKESMFFWPSFRMSIVPNW